MKPLSHFKHGVSARNQSTMQLLASRHGAAGVGVYWCLVEMIFENGGFISMDIALTLANVLQAREEMIRSVVEDFGLFSVSDTTITSTSATAEIEKWNTANRGRSDKLKEFSRRVKKKVPTETSPTD